MSTSGSEQTVTLRQGTAPLLVSMPHLGTHIPDDILSAMTPVAAHVDDTDWHLDRLYGFLDALGASVAMPKCSRYVVDLNRPPNDANLYPGQNTTGLLPRDTFNEDPLYAPGAEPDDAERERRRALYWQPYHDALAAEIERLRALHGRVLLWEAHSIRSRVPRFFEGQLPDFNFGTVDDTTAPPDVGAAMVEIATRSGQFTAVSNGRFKGGHITRHYADPARGVHVVQLELSQITYMQETRPYDYLPERAAQVAPIIRECMETALNLLK